jgi:hypothetical protein
MPVDESTRLRIRQYLIELMDEGAADAMMESMPPIPWTQLATKDDIAQLDRRLGGVEGRLDGVEGRLDVLTLRADQTSSDLQELTRLVAAQGVSLGSRIDSLSERIDGLSERTDGLSVRIDSLGVRIDGLARAVMIGAASMVLTLAVFIIGTIASLIASGAVG